MQKASLTKEITVETANSVGIAANLTKLVSSQAKTNIRAAWAVANNGKGHFGLITDDNQKVFDVLKKNYPETKEHEVIVVAVPNSLGSIAEVTNQLSGAGLNIDYIFTTYYQDKPALVLSTNDNKKAMDVINQ